MLVSDGLRACVMVCALPSGLNPCFSGCWSRTDTFVCYIHKYQVLILVLVDVGLGLPAKSRLSLVLRLVLILVLVDVGLGRYYA